MHAAQPALRLVETDDTELAAALSQLDAASRAGERTPAHLLAVCTAAQHEIASIEHGERTLEWPQLAQAMHADEQVQAAYARTGHPVPAMQAPTQTPPRELIQASAQLFREISAIYACEVNATGTVTAPPDKNREPALRVTRALWCLGMSAKWTYFMHVKADGGLWRACHAQYLRAENLDIAHRAVHLYSEPELGALSCADVYVQTLLLGMLNAGNLSAQQIELAHRWVTAFVRNAGIQRSGDDAKNIFHVCLDSERGLEAGTPTGGKSPAVRFVDIEPVCAKLIDSRENLRRGKIDLGEAEAQSAVLDYGAFLDLAERFWTPGTNQVQERAPRLNAAAESVAALVGFDGLMQALGGTAAMAGSQQSARDANSASNIEFLYPDAPRKHADTLACTLKDYSDTGVGLLLPDSSTPPPTGTLLAFRRAGGRWEAGVLVRQLVLVEAGQVLLGIKTISCNPVIVTLEHANATPAQSRAVFAPGDDRRSRADSLILSDATYSRTRDLILPAGKSKYHVRLTRVLDRGAGWLRAGYTVLSRK